MLLLAGALIVTHQAAAQTTIPRLLSYQGVLADSKRTAVVDGQYTVTFRIYDSETGGTALWEEMNTVQTVDGIFETILGMTKPITLPFDRSYWVALELQGEPEMAPRVRFVATPYAMRSILADGAMQLDPNATGVVHTLNGLDGNLVLKGEGGANIRIAGDTIAVVVPSMLPANATNGQIIRWNGTTNAWEAVDLSIATSPRLKGDGTTGSPLDIAQMGATEGQPLIWDDVQKLWRPGTTGVRSTSPLKGDGTPSAPLGLQDGTADRQVIAWDAASSSWKPAEQRVNAAGEISGDGASATPLRLAQQGATGGQVLRWDDAAKGWRPGPAVNLSNPPLRGTGSVTDPLALIDGAVAGQILYWNGTAWQVNSARRPQEGEMLRWNEVQKIWEPAPITVTNVVSLSPGAVWYGATNNRATELAIGRPNEVMIVDPTGLLPRWSNSLKVDTIDVGELNVRGDVTMNGTLHVKGATMLDSSVSIGRSLSVTGAVNLAPGVIDNNELANSSINVQYGPGVSGDASVTLGDTLHMQNTGVLSIAGTPNQVNASAATGNVTLSLPQDIHNDARPQFDGITLDNLTGNSVSDTLLVTKGGVVESRPAASLTSHRVQYGAGLAGDAAVMLGDTLHIRNTGVLSITGTPNQVNASAANGDVTLSLPQDIHTDARPRFDGVTLDNLTAGSTSDTLLVSNGGVVQSRTVASITSQLALQYWSTTGNTGTTAGTNYIGTNDNQPLQLHVDNANAAAANGRGRVMRFEPNATSANIIGGHSSNSVAAGIVGATIAGGGRSGGSNTIAGNAGTIAGGYRNSIATGSDDATIGGGQTNAVNAARGTIAGGISNIIRISATSSTIAGGQSNTIDTSASSSTIGGGTSNRIGTGANTSVIAGGTSNSIAATASTSTIAGGNNNVINSTTAVIAGGDNASIGTNARWSSIQGGHNNRILDNAYESTLGGGEGNVASAVRNTIGGGSFNSIGTSSDNGTIAGGYGNTIRNNSDRSTIAGGMSNLINPSASIGTIGGGFQNTIDTSATTSFIGGGSNNRNAGSVSVIGGGDGNYIVSGSTRAVIAGGFRNYIASGSGSSAIIGGETDSIQTGSSQSIIGGANNKIGTSSSQSTVLGGSTNSIGNSAGGSTITGGSNNAISDNARYSTIAGGRGLTIASRSFGFLGNNDVGTRNMSVTATDVAVFGNTDIWLANNDNAAGQFRFYEANNTTGAFPGTANYSSFQAQAQTADINYVLPDTAGIVGDLLKVKTVAGTTVTLDWAADASAAAWALTGNSGTTPGTNYIGTNDDRAFQIHIGNGVTSGTDGRGRVMRYEPNATSANIIGGYASNSIAGGVVGSTILGGGSNGNNHSISSNYGTIAGGNRNTIGASSINSTISGGVSNSVTASAGNGTIGGGLGNVITSGDHATIGGGFNNRINSGSFGVTVAGGTNNAVSSHTSVVSGGNGNTIGTSSQFSHIAGGNSNAIGNSAFESSIQGGTLDSIEASSSYATIGGGTSNTIRSNSTRSTIAGGYDNEIGSGSDRATISGGELNVIGGGAYRSVIAGGYQNTIVASSSGRWAVIGGGEQNYIGGISSTIAGGTHDTIEAQNGFIGGGDLNAIRTLARFGVIAGGRSNQISSNADYTVIAGGNGLTLGGSGSFGFLGGNTGSNNMTVNTANTAVFGNTDLWLANNNSTPSKIRFYESYGTSGTFPNTANYSSFQAQAQTADINYVLPDTAGIAGDILAVKSVAGTTVTLDWAAAGGSSDWSRTGNAGTTAGTNYIGTNDDEPFQIHVDNANTTGTDGRGRVLRFEPNATSPNIIGGYSGNTVAAGVTGAVIAGGGQSTQINSISANSSAIGGGVANLIESGATNSTISGGTSSEIRSNATSATISGGNNNEIQATSTNATVGGGESNTIGTTSHWATIGGGRGNSVSAIASSVFGGQANSINSGAVYAFIGGGVANTIGANAQRAVITGGADNTIGAGAVGSIIAGGENNAANSSYGTVLGGRGLTLGGNSSFGYLGNNSGNTRPMTVNDANVAVIGNNDLWLANNDNTPSQIRFYSDYNTSGAFPNGTKYISFRAPTALAADAEWTLPATTGGVGDQLTISAVAGSQVTLAWAAPSDRRIKSDIITLDGEKVLAKFRDVELGSWRYTNDASDRRHYGIMAQDFHKLFGDDGVGTIGTDTTVNNLDMMGVSYLAIQGLEKRTATDRAEIEELKAMINTLKQEVEALREENRQLQGVK